MTKTSLLQENGGQEIMKVYNTLTRKKEELIPASAE